VKAFGWSLYDLDRTDIESLLPFVAQLMGKTEPALISADDPRADWLLG
jgi:hypothetical protein